MGRYWKKPSRPEIGKLLDRFHNAGWRIEDPPTYYTVKCPCGEHQRRIHLTPSSNNYVKNAAKWLDRQSCNSDDE